MFGLLQQSQGEGSANSAAAGQQRSVSVCLDGDAAHAIVSRMRFVRACARTRVSTLATNLLHAWSLSGYLVPCFTRADHRSYNKSDSQEYECIPAASEFHCTAAACANPLYDLKTCVATQHLAQAAVSRRFLSTSCYVRQSDDAPVQCNVKQCTRLLNKLQSDRLTPLGELSERHNATS